MLLGEVRHVVVLVSRHAWPVSHQIVKADAVLEGDSVVRLERDGQAVFQIPRGAVISISHFAHQREAASALREAKEVLGRGALRVHELDLPVSSSRSGGSSDARGGPTEGIGFRIEEH